MCVCVYVLGRKRSRVFASRAQVVVQLAMYLTNHSDCLTIFCEPVLSPYRCCTGLKTQHKNILYVYIGSEIVFQAIISVSMETKV